MLVFLCLIMLVGSYLAGILPLIVTLSEVGYSLFIELMYMKLVDRYS